MHPAFSVIFLTTLIGAGQGLFLALYTSESYAAFGLLAAPDAHAFYVPGAAVSMALLVAGLIASFFHLGRPERAWRSAAKWRTSWLSREVIALPAFMGLVTMWGMSHANGVGERVLFFAASLPVTVSLLIGAAATIVCFALFVCTGMIYACLKFLREWHSPLTVVNFILLGGASGFALATALAAFMAPDQVAFLGGWAVILTLVAAAGRAAALVRNARLRPISTLQTAIGVRHPGITQKARGFLGPSFNTREFFHGRSAEFVRRMKWTFLLCAFGLPLVLLAIVLAGGGALAAVAAVVIQYLGLVAERWTFFAEARHPQNLYYAP